MKYLVSLVSGPAASCIAGLTISDDNYASAVDLLQKRFGNTELLINEHVDSLLDLAPVLSMDNVNGLRSLHEAVTVRVRNLESLGVQMNQYAITVHRGILRKIPPELELEYYRGPGKDSATDTLTTLLSFLQKEIECVNESDASPTTAGDQVEIFQGTFLAHQRRHFRQRHH